jgi:hypothetical protein
MNEYIDDNEEYLSRQEQNMVTDEIRKLRYNIHNGEIVQKT